MPTAVITITDSDDPSKRPILTVSTDFQQPSPALIAAAMAVDAIRNLIRKEPNDDEDREAAAG